MDRYVEAANTLGRGGQTANVSPACLMERRLLLAIMEIHARGANRLQDLEGHRSYRLFPAPVRPVRHQFDGYPRSLGRREQRKSSSPWIAKPPRERTGIRSRECKRPRRCE